MIIEVILVIAILFLSFWFIKIIFKVIVLLIPVLLGLSLLDYYGGWLGAFLLFLCIFFEIFWIDGLLTKSNK